MSYGRLKRELRRALANKQYEPTDEGGILFPRANLSLGGIFDIQLNDGPIEYFHNMIVGEYRQDALEILFGASSKDSAFYLAPFATNATPTASWTAANFGANTTEFTSYDEGTRPVWTTGSVTESGGTYSIGNSASKATITVDNSGQTTVWGLALLTASGKGASTGAMVAASKAAAARDNLVDGDQLTFGERRRALPNS